ncbi:UDP-2,3-diacylglucosamine diphosphatase LpxI [Cyanobium sp. HWJ4-Hawea]|nr:UDP-2,3-diacylglucosamine diphosphatase LpxI [Cyanobium sp. WAJ14-Wanaka]MCP9775781.1 UDP-2,3-diacylglucosamine diphosphatase LpxI [Cyanobium sp. WAJ14-Wanaka]MCP9808339.1 UDP-2,3-diacylglucosamine diphosphatase LpxI [Cyanobium sp. HWJ4-Hawea]
MGDPSLAIIAGSGVMPRMLSEALTRAGREHLVCFPQGLEVEIEGAEPFYFERSISFFKSLEKRGIQQVVMVGKFHRPKSLNVLRFEAPTLMAAPRILASLRSGDDAALRALAQIIEELGLQVVGIEEVAPNLLTQPGLYAGRVPTEAERADVERAAYIVEAISAVDVGQGAVVAAGLCLATEALPGTDAMLDWISAIRPQLPDAVGSGVLYKGPKLHQDRRMDLPGIGPITVAKAAAAGLTGIAWEARGALLLDAERTMADAERLGLFLWSREPLRR